MDSIRSSWLVGSLAVLMAATTGCALPSVTQPSVAQPSIAPVSASPKAPIVQQASHTEELPSGAPVPLPPVHEPATDPGVYPISLPTALQLADAENLQVAFAREQIRQAYARVDRAEVLWLPSVRGGVNYNRHEGAIQDVVGNQFNTSRGAFYTGLGAGGYGAGSPPIPGLYMNFHLADAIFQPLAARQFAGSRERLAVAARNDALLRISLAYLELQRAGEEAEIALEAQQHTQLLARLTSDYSQTGQGLRSDADRAAAEVALRRNDVARGEESTMVASARLAQLLRLHPTLKLQPLEPMVVPIELTNQVQPLPELVSQGLTNRPELSANRFLVNEAVERLRREKCAPLIPSVILGASYGGMGAGIGSNLQSLQDRFDMDAIAFWEVRNLGAGERAARSDAKSQVQQARLRELEALDQVAREVVEAHAQVAARKRQIAVAKEGVAAAQSSYDRNRERIQGAQGLPIEVLQSIQALAQARREYLRAVVDYNMAQFTLHRALGCPIQFDQQQKPDGHG